MNREQTIHRRARRRGWRRPPPVDWRPPWVATISEWAGRYNRPRALPPRAVAEASTIRAGDKTCDVDGIPVRMTASLIVRSFSARISRQIHTVRTNYGCFPIPRDDGTSGELGEICEKR